MTDRLSELLEVMAAYTGARRELLEAIGCGTSNRDPLAEFSECLMAAALDAEHASSRVQAYYDLTDGSGRRIQVKYLANPSAGWVNEHTVHFVSEVDDYAIVFFEDLMPIAAISFSREHLVDVCSALGKRHPNQENTLQFTRRNFNQILDERDRFAPLGVKVFDFAKPAASIPPLT